MVAMRVTPELFTTRHFRTIAKAAIDHISRYGESPKNHLPDILESELNKGEASAVLWKQIGRMEEIYPEVQPDYVTDQLDQFISLHKIRLALATAAEHVQKGDLIKAQEAMHVIDVGTKMEPGIWMNEADQALRFLDKTEDDEFNLGIQALDSRGVRPARKTMLVIMAPKKRGKSMGLINIGKQAAYIDRKNVLHITLEMSEDDVAKRYTQSICGWTAAEAAEKALRIPLFKRDDRGNYIGMDFDLITPTMLNRQTRKEAAQRLRTVSRGNRRLLIKEFPTASLTTSQLIMFLEYLKRTEKFEPDMLIIDYANLMHMNAAQVRTETGRIFRELRGIGMARNLAVVTATQGNRLSETSRIVGSTHVSEDWSVMGTADIVLTICQTPEEKEKRLARLLVAAARSVPDGYLVLISQAYETCQFATDSIYMNKIANRDFSQMMDGDPDD
jgi:hypothetical protein